MIIQDLMEIIMEKSIPIKTPIGIFENYRDSIILKNIEWKDRQIIFYCNISKHGIIPNCPLKYNRLIINIFF